MQKIMTNNLSLIRINQYGVNMGHNRGNQLDAPSPSNYCSAWVLMLAKVAANTRGCLLPSPNCRLQMEGPQSLTSRCSRHGLANKKASCSETRANGLPTGAVL